MKVCWRSFVVGVWGLLLSISAAPLLPAQEADSSQQASATQPSANSEEFDKRLDRLQRANPAVEGRDKIAADLEDLLSSFPKHERRGEAMLHIADLYTLSNPSAGYEADPEASLNWYRQASESLAVGSPLWSQATIRYASHLQDSSSGRSALTKARSLLEKVVQKSESLVSQLHGEFGLIDQSFHEKNPLGIELHANRILDWQPEEDAFFTDEERQLIQGLKFGAVRQLIELAENANNLDGLATASVAGTKAQRIDYVNELVERYPMPPLRQFADQAIARIKEASEPPPPAPFVDTPLEAKSSPVRTMFLIANVVVVIVLAAILAVRWKQRCSATPSSV
ncbi:MAG: hypothetical protein MI725_11975 [Pirellulales bacterium]|nr:hypothetical protein [Pirellulales bacterium]